MGRQGLSKLDCAEVLAELRRGCPTISDEVLVWLAETFALEATVDFDPNDLIALLGQSGKKVVHKETFSLDKTPIVALQTILCRLRRETRADEHFSGGLLICRVTREQLKRYWPDSINEMMIQVRELVGRRGSADFGVVIDEGVGNNFELFILLSTSSTTTSSKLSSR